MLADEFIVLRVPEQFVDRMEHPKRGIHGVVFGLFANVGKPVRKHSLIDAARERKQNLARFFKSARYQRKPRQRNHRVAAPVAEPVVAGNDRLLFAASDDKLVRRGGQLTLELPVLSHARDYDLSPLPLLRL